MEDTKKGEEKKKKIDFKYNLKLYFSFLVKYKLYFIATLVSVLIIEITHVADKYIFKKIIDEGTVFAAGNLTKDVFLKDLSVFAIAFLCVVITATISKWLRLHFLNRLDGNLIYDVRVFFFNHIISLSHNFHTTHKTGSLISRLTRGGRAMEHMTDIITFNIVPLIFQLIIVSLSIVFFDMMSTVAILITITVFILFSYLLQTKMQCLQLKANDADDFEKAKIADFFTNIESIKYFGKEEYIKNNYSKISSNTKECFVKFWDYYRWLDFGQTLILGIGTFFVIALPIMSFLDGKTTIGTVIFIYTVFGTLLDPLYSFVRGMRDFYTVMGDFESLFLYSKIEREVKDKKDAPNIKIKTPTISFNNVTFTYGKRKIFDNFSLNIQKNKKIALVGHSGSGKTTLIKLLYRLYDVDSGTIIVDNKNILDVKQESLREEMSIVPQECVLFDDSIYNNISFSNPTAKREEVLAAIKFAQLDKIIQQFSDKENTLVGERGIKLSGGEKQRVSIARAILANKKILVLDEATSSLDSQTEHEIQKDLQRLMKGRTSIIIAHRLSTIMYADKIVVMKNGKVVESGKHNELIKKKGEYQKLWKLQKGGYIK